MELDNHALLAYGKNLKRQTTIFKSKVFGYLLYHITVLVQSSPKIRTEYTFYLTQIN